MKKNLLILAGVAGLATLATVSVAQRAITIRGSDTMLPLNQRWAEEYAKAGGGPVNITGGGSSIGINSFINGVADIAASSRAMRKSEVDRARSRGATANEIPVALDGLAIIVHPSNPIRSLTMDELRRIYIGQVTNWNQVGGPNLPVTTFSRDSNSGTYGFFQQNVLRGQNWGKGVRFMPSTSEEVREVSRNTGGIAYGGVAYFKNNSKVKIIPIARTAGSAPVAPTEANVRNKSYPIWRFLYYYTNGRPSGETKKFIDFALSARGQQLVEEVGYYSLR